jgi:hypothetical protein
VRRIFIFIFALVAFFPLLAPAKDMTYRLGVGFKNNSAEDIPSIAGVYFQSKDFALTGSVGFDSREHYSKTAVNVGIRSVIFYEPNLNAYVGGQAGLINYETPAIGKKSGAELMALAGVEFFFSGLENLGFSAETGVALATADGPRFRTLADHPFRAGVIFYF